MASKLFLHISVSLDGRIADGQGKLDWMNRSAEFHEHIRTVLHSISGMVFGRVAFEELAHFWPQAGGSDDPDIRAEAEPMNRLPKFVLSRRALPRDWAHSRAVALEDLARLKQEASAPIAVFAGAGTAQATLDRGLLDEVVLLRHPVLLGGGKPLFADDDTVRRLALLETKRFASGIVLERYETASH